MKLIYPAVFHEDSDGVWVEFPDLQGCQSFGETLGEALDGAKEALEGYCVTLLEEKCRLPAASDIKSIKPGENAFVSLVKTELREKNYEQIIGVRYPVASPIIAGRSSITKRDLRAVAAKRALRAATTKRAPRAVAAKRALRAAAAKRSADRKSNLQNKIAKLYDEN